jgi:hypothetical protein
MDIWALRVHLQMENRVRELALFNLGIDTKLAELRSTQGSCQRPPTARGGCVWTAA